MTDRASLALLALLAAFALAAGQLGAAIPLAEAPDEMAHWRYLDFIVTHHRLPQTVAERQTAGYRSDWPPLYQLTAWPLAARYASQATASPPLRLIGDNPRRLIALDGYHGLIALHTEDESPPFWGLPLAWHRTRLLSMVFSLGTLALIFASLRRHFATIESWLGTAVVAVLPVLLIMSAVLNDDALLAFWVALFWWLLLPLLNEAGRPVRYVALGLVAGLALTTKYSTLLLSMDLLWVWLIARRRPAIKNVAAFVVGGLLGAGWWVAFLLCYFNRFDELGWLGGALAPFLTGGTDVSTHRIAAALRIGGDAAALPSAAPLDWPGWLKTLFVSFWFGTDAPPGWWLSLLVVSLAALWLVSGALKTDDARSPVAWLAGAHILLFLPFPMLRFYLTHNVAETAQGRHVLLPILPPLAFLLTLAAARLPGRFPGRIALAGLAAGLATAMAVVVWPAVTRADMPPLPVRTVAPESPAIDVHAGFGDGVTLLGVTPGPAVDGPSLLLSLLWQADSPPPMARWLGITLFDASGAVVGVWQGQPVDGRYPTQAWEAGDIIRDDIAVPALPGSRPVTARISLTDTPLPPVATPPDDRTVTVDLPPTAMPDAARPGLSPVAVAARFRATIVVRVTNWPAGANGVALRHASGQTIPPLAVWPDERPTVALFWVNWDWPSGEFSPVLVDLAGKVVATLPGVATVSLNRRLTTVPSIDHAVQANFGNVAELLGYSLSSRRIQAGSAMEVELVWRALQPTTINYKVFNHLLDESQTQRGGDDRIPQGFYSTVLWQSGEIIIDRYPVFVAPDAPNGVYWLDVGLYPADNPAAPPLSLVENGRPVAANSVRLGPLKVGGQPEASIPTGGPPAYPIDARFGDVIRLAGYTIALDGDTLRLQLVWRAEAVPPTDYTVFVHVLDETGLVVAQADAPPLAGGYPTSLWDAGETIFDPRTVSLAGLPSGRYGLRLGWYDPQTGARLPVDGRADGALDVTTVVRP